MKTIKVSEEVHDYLKCMIDDEQVSNSDDSEERNANGETVAHRPSFSEVIGHLIEDREAEPRVWQITEEREAAVDFAIEYISANDSNDPGICFCVASLRAMLTEAE